MTQPASVSSVSDAGFNPNAELLDVLAALGKDERQVLLVLARRLLAGQTMYGRLDLATDRRDWRKERVEELADALVYGAIPEVATTLGRGKPDAP